VQTILTQLPAALFEAPDVVRAITDASDRLMRTSDDALVLGQYWLGLHFTLSGETPLPSTEARRRGVEWLNNPLEDALMGGEDAGIADDLGGARFHRPPAVSRIAVALARLSDEDLRRKFDPVALTENDIPPAGWDDPEMWDGLVTEFRALREFYTSCHAAGAGVLLRVVTA
jgi:hypothetical protein